LPGTWQDRNFPGIGETISSYCSLLVYYDPFLLSRSQAASRIEEVLRGPIAEEESFQNGQGGSGSVRRGMGFRIWLWLPNGITFPRKEVVKLHTAETFLVYVVGFSPGFAAMGTVPEKNPRPSPLQPKD